MNIGAVILLVFFLFLAWVYGFEVGRRSKDEETGKTASSWYHMGHWLKRYIKQPGPALIIVLFLVLIFFRVLIVLVPALLVLLIR
jgi:hypothetical protein